MRTATLSPSFSPIRKEERILHRKRRIAAAIASNRRMPLAPFVIGVLIGLVWLIPGFVDTPGARILPGDSIDPVRVLRIVMPLLVWLFAYRRGLLVTKRFLAILLFRLSLPKIYAQLLLISLALGVLPLLSGLLSGDVGFIISVCLPLIVSLLVLMGIILLDGEIFRAWVFGIGIVAFGFLILGIAKSGMSTTTYYGRSRALMGFGHPLQTASVILGTMIFFALWLGRNIRRLPLVGMGMIGFVSVASVYLLYASQSRNTLFFVILLMIGSVFFRRIPRTLRVLFVGITLLACFFLYGFSAAESNENPIWLFLNDLASNRLVYYQSTLQVFLKQPWYSILFSTNERVQANYMVAVTYRGFAAVDSVYLSFLFNYGLVSLLCLIGMLLLVGWKLARNKNRDFFILYALILYFGLDVQGITVSNLAVFIIFGYTIRSSILSNDRWRLYLT